MLQAAQVLGLTPLQYSVYCIYREYHPTWPTLQQVRTIAARLKRGASYAEIVAAVRHPNPKPNPRKKITKKMMQPVVEVFQQLVSVAATQYPKVALTKLEADASVHDTPRSYAMAGIEKDGPKIKVAPELASRPVSEIHGVLAHELGHIVVMLGHYPMLRGHDACQRQADKVAEKVFGKPIYYKANGVQCMGRGARGKRPRPKGLK